MCQKHNRFMDVYQQNNKSHSSMCIHFNINIYIHMYEHCTTDEYCFIQSDFSANKIIHSTIIPSIHLDTLRARMFVFVYFGGEDSCRCVCVCLCGSMCVFQLDRLTDRHINSQLEQYTSWLLSWFIYVAVSGSVSYHKYLGFQVNYK